MRDCEIISDFSTLGSDLLQNLEEWSKFKDDTHSSGLAGAHSSMAQESPTRRVAGTVALYAAGSLDSMGTQKTCFVGRICLNWS